MKFGARPGRRESAPADFKIKYLQTLIDINTDRRIKNSSRARTGSNRGDCTWCFERSCLRFDCTDCYFDFYFGKKNKDGQILKSHFKAITMLAQLGLNERVSERGGREKEGMGERKGGKEREKAERERESWWWDTQ